MLFPGALSGVRVLDVTQAYAGPFCAQLLADQGADVIKVEGPEGDVNRILGPRPADDTTRAYAALFQHCNRNKRGIVIDLKSDAGRAAFLDLVKTADVLIENFRFGVMDRLGLGYETLQAVNPRLVYTSVRGFGDKAGGLSPLAPYPAVDMTAQAYGGVMSITGPDANTPTKIGGGWGDTVPGLWAAFATVTALFEARASGQGQYVDIAMADTILAMCEGISSFYGYDDSAVPGPTGNRLPDIVPFGTVRAKDGHVALAVPPGRAWGVFCGLIDRPDLIERPDFATIPARRQNAEAVYAEVEKFTMSRTKDELSAVFGDQIPFSPIMDAKDIHGDSHFAAREMLVEIDHPGSARRLRTIGTPVKLSRTPGGVRHRAPVLGEHTDEVLTEAGFDAERVAALRASGAIR
ncbi:MAG: CoA transferase [Rhodobacter sp.]|nr:CoA transferase [Paracoccaceae bacterium]MCC0075469.1 CoA transferase [Rhodobacter sp.]